MKRITLLTFAIFGFLYSFSQYGSSGGVAPMAALNSGDVSSLDNVTKVNLIYDYSDLSVGAFRKEEDYVNKRVTEIEEKKPGTSDKFKESWVNSRQKTYEPQFELLFNKYAPKDINMSGANYATDNDYTLLVHTVFIEPGVNVGIYKKPAFIDLELTFKDKDGKSLCVFYVKNAIGAQAMGFDYDVSSRLKESYGKAAKMLIGAIVKERKKAAKKKK